MRAVQLALCAVPLVAGCGDKQAKSAAPLEGWQGEQGWAGQCYYPKNYEQLGVGDRKLASSAAIAEMVDQWGGGRGDGIDFNEDDVVDFETVLLGQPHLVEQVSLANLEQCQKAMTSGDATAWGRWVASEPGRLTEGQCTYAPFDYQLFDYLDIQRGWQISAYVCQGNKVRIKGSVIDKYKITKDGPWIDVDGDASQSALGTGLPCASEGCLAGQLILRFTGDSGAQQIIPVGAEHTFVAPEHGMIEIQINDDTWYDNTFKIEGSIEHHTSIEYSGL